MCSQSKCGASGGRTHLSSHRSSTVLPLEQTLRQVVTMRHLETFEPAYDVTEPAHDVQVPKQMATEVVNEPPESVQQREPVVEAPAAKPRFDVVTVQQRTVEQVIDISPGDAGVCCSAATYC